MAMRPDGRVHFLLVRSATRDAEVRPLDEPCGGILGGRDTLSQHRRLYVIASGVSSPQFLFRSSIS